MLTPQAMRDRNLRCWRQPFDILRAAHVELVVTDLSRARAWYVDVLGFVVTAEEPGALYLRGLEEAVHHSLVLRQGEAPRCGHIAFRVASPDDPDRLAHLCSSQGLPTRWLQAGAEPGQGRALRTVDPSGLPVEFFAEMERAPRLLQEFHLYRGAHIMRLDHFNVMVPTLEKSFAWWTEALGFRVSEYTDTDAPDFRLWAVWLHRKPNVHDLALTNGAGPRLHHVGFWVAGTESVLRACDLLAATGWHTSIERGPGRHGLSNAFFLYLRDPDGHRIELYTGDYLTCDPDGEPLRWSIHDPRRQTFWGQPAPASWFEEASVFLDPAGTGDVPLQPPALQVRPVTQPSTSGRTAANAEAARE